SPGKRRSNGRGVFPIPWARTRKPKSKSASCSSWTTSGTARRWSGFARWAWDPRNERPGTSVPGGRLSSDAHRAIDAVWRIESARLIAGLTRIVRDVGLAEDLAQDALVAALEQWPESGVPENPGAWLMATAKHRAIDRLRHGAMAERKHAEIARSLELAEEPDLAAAIDD